LAVVIAIAILTATAAANDYACGDFDGNGIVSGSDAVYSIEYVLTGGPPPDSRGIQPMSVKRRFSHRGAGIFLLFEENATY
jgi:hypothetical protein